MRTGMKVFITVLGIAVVVMVVAPMVMNWFVMM